MKNLLIYIFISFTIIGCLNNEKEVCKKGLPDKQYDFLSDIKRYSNFNYLEVIVDFRQFGAYSDNLWLRKPENLKRVYSSLKQIGLKNIISEQEFNRPLFTEHWTETCWANNSLNQIVQNLILSYSDTTEFDNYYIEFWNRRKADANESVVFKILSDIENTYNSDSSSFILNWEAEPTISGLLEFEIKLKQSNSLTKKKTIIEYYDYLKTIGLYASANNLIRFEYERLIEELGNEEIDYLELINQIETDSVKCENYWNWRHNAEWFHEIYDYGL